MLIISGFLKALIRTVRQCPLLTISVVVHQHLVLEGHSLPSLSLLEDQTVVHQVFDLAGHLFSELISITDGAWLLLRLMMVIVSGARCDSSKVWRWRSSHGNVSSIWVSSPVEAPKTISRSSSDWEFLFSICRTLVVSFYPHSVSSITGKGAMIESPASSLSEDCFSVFILVQRNNLTILTLLSPHNYSKVLDVSTCACEDSI